MLVLLTIGVITGVGLLVEESVGYRVVAFALLLAVALMAALMDIGPVVLGAVLSAVLWDFLFIPPRFDFSVGSTEDGLLLATYFIVALIHGILTNRIRKAQEQVRLREEKANAVKFYNTLLNSLSHELRTPITAIIAAVDHLQQEGSQRSATAQRELLHEIATAGWRLNDQVENLLNMSRLESGVFRVRKDWCDIRELVYHVLQKFDAEVKRHPVSVVIPENFPLFKLDVGLMEQVLMNLIRNINQHTLEGTAFKIQASSEDDKLQLTVTDSGKGFPVDEVPFVFEKFYRVKGSVPGGTGLGLSIVRGFVEAQGGTVTLRNAPEGGAEFMMTFETEISYISRLKNE